MNAALPAPLRRPGQRHESASPLVPPPPRPARQSFIFTILESQYLSYPSTTYANGTTVYGGPRIPGETREDLIVLIERYRDGTERGRGGGGSVVERSGRARA